MKRLACEMCGSADIVKKDGLFECQVCGCKYTLEEARKMLVEGAVEIQGTVEVKGTVQVDNTSYVQRYLQNARRAKEKEDWSEVEKYYNLVEQNDPDNIEAIFYSAYGKAMQTLVPPDIYPRQAAFKVLNNCVSIIDDHYNPSNAEAEEPVIRAMTTDVINMLSSNFVYNYRKNEYGTVIWSDKDDTYQLYLDFQATYIESIQNIIHKDDRLFLHEELLRLYQAIHELPWISSKLFEAVDDLIRDKKRYLEEQHKRAYWKTHDINGHYAQKDKLENEILALQDLIDAEYHTVQVSKLIARIEELQAEIDQLGMFKGKEKKELRAQIDQLIEQRNEEMTLAEDATAAQRQVIQQKIRELEAIDQMLDNPEGA